MTGVTTELDAQRQDARPKRGGVDLVDLKKSYGKNQVVHGIDLTVPPGHMVSLLGPSGCGKTTTLRMIAGLEEPDGGEILVGGSVLSHDGYALPPEKRNMGMVFQSYALWPHMDVFDNVAYALKRHSMPKAEIATVVNDVLSTVGMASYAQRFPSQLSGGQQQRVALARAIAHGPDVLLFDEPLSNLDAVLRESMRFEIRALQQRLGISGVYVTHSQDEALALSDSLAIMRDGRIVQHGPPEEVYESPRTEFVANFIGLANVMTLHESRRSGAGFEGRLDNGAVVHGLGRASAYDQERADRRIAVRPERMRIVLGQAPEGAQHLRGRVRNTNFTGSIVDYFVEVGEGIVLRIQSTPPVAAAPGDEVSVVFDADAVILLDDLVGETAHA